MIYVCILRINLEMLEADVLYCPHQHQGSLISLAIPFHATTTPFLFDESYAFRQYEYRFGTCTVSFLVF